MTSIDHIGYSGWRGYCQGTWLLRARTFLRDGALPFVLLLTLFAHSPAGAATSVTKASQVSQAGTASASAAPESADALKLGVIPYLSTRSLLNFYEPLQKALEAKFGKRVELLTAPDYATFHHRTVTGGYDIVITNPVYGRLAQKEAGHEPVARATTNLAPVLIVPLKSAAGAVSDLSGKTIAITEQTATITQIGQQYLRQQGVKDVKFVITRSHPNSIAYLERGEADAAISSNTALKQAVPAARANVKVLHEIGSQVPPIMYLLAPTKKGIAAAALRDALFEFAASEAGKRYIEALGHEGIAPVTAKEMSALDGFAEELKPLIR
jgi:phosphonate transport system substrate-binding protein